MTLSLTQNVFAVGPNVPASFLGVGGVRPYVYAVLPGGAGGTITNKGVYTAPAVANSDPVRSSDTVKVTDASLATATAQILVGSPLLLFCDVLQQGLGLAPGRVYLWDQKIMQPTDSGLYIAVSISRCRPFGNVNTPNSSGAGVTQDQYVTMQATADLDIISRGPEARDRKEEVILALNSTYSQQQQTTNSFTIGKLPPFGGFINLSNQDGAAIPYRFRISVNLLYAVSKSTAIGYYSVFAPAALTIAQ